MRLEMPVTKEFLFDVEDRPAGVRVLVPTQDPEHAAIRVTFRQGTNQDDERRSGLYARRKFVYDASEGLTEVNEFSPASMARLEVYLTLCDTDLQLPDGKSLEFVDDGGVRRVKDEAQFGKWWGSMRRNWALELHRVCLEVNTDWDPSKSPRL